MEINIKVAVELPEWLEALAKQIAANGKVSTNNQQAPAEPEKPAAPAAAAPKPAAPAPKPAAPAPKPKPAAPAPKPKPAAPATKPAEAEAEETEEESEHTLEELRDLLKSKVEGNTSTIKAKLNEFGAVSLSKLDPEYYDAMYAFLSQL